MNFMQYIRIFALAYLSVTLSLSGFTQELSVYSGVMSISDGTSLSLNETSLYNQGELICEDGSTIALQGSEDITISGTSLDVYALLINAPCLLNTDLTIRESIDLNSGSFDLDNYYMYLEGEILNENNTNRIYASGSGEIVVNSPLIANSLNEFGNIGLSITATDKLDLLEVRRGHIPSSNARNNTSIERYFTLSPSPVNYAVKFSYIEEELNNIEEYALEMWGEADNEWQQVPNSSIAMIENQLVATIETPFEKITAYPIEPDQIVIPTGFSPNDDGINDFFIIAGAENYPTNKLIIFNQWGETLFEASPYLNDWSGTSDTRLTSKKNDKLSDGTYFYIFYKEASNSSQIEKGYLEIKNTSN